MTEMNSSASYCTIPVLFLALPEGGVNYVYPVIYAPRDLARNYARDGVCTCIPVGAPLVGRLF